MSSPADPEAAGRRLELVAAESGERLDRYVSAHLPDLSRARVQRLIDDGAIRVDNRPTKPSYRLVAGNRVTVELREPEPSGIVPQEIPLSVIYEDADLLVVDKPAGLVVHPAAGHDEGTLVNALIAHVADLQGISGELRPGVVHRLDKDTSGLLVIAKNDAALAGLQQQFQDRTVAKQYLTLVAGALSPAVGAVEAPIGRDPRDRKKMAVLTTGRPARTEYRVLELLRRWTFVAAHPVTGRTHQIRVHFSAIGHPVLGDAVYGRPYPGLDRHFLHAARLGFKHPGTGVPLDFESPLPPELQAVLDAERRR